MRRGIRSRTRLGEAVAAEVGHRGQARQPRAALLVGAVGVDHPRDHVVDRDVGGDRGVGLGQLLDDRDGVGAAEGRSAHVLADVDAAEAELAGHAQGFAREVLLLVPLECVRRELGLREVAHRLEDRRALVRGQGEHRLHLGLPLVHHVRRVLRHCADSFRADVGTMIILAGLPSI